MDNNSEIFLFGRIDEDGNYLSRWGSRKAYNSKIVRLEANLIDLDLLHAIYFYRYNNSQRSEIIKLLKNGLNISIRQMKDHWGVDFCWIEEIFDRDFGNRDPDFNLIEFFENNNYEEPILSDFEEYYRVQSKLNQYDGWGSQRILVESSEVDELSNDINKEKYQEDLKKHIARSNQKAKVILYGKRNKHRKLLTIIGANFVEDDEPVFINHEQITEYLHAIRFIGFSEYQENQILRLISSILMKRYRYVKKDNKIYWVLDETQEIWEYEYQQRNSITVSRNYSSLSNTYERWEICDPDLLENWDEENRR